MSNRPLSAGRTVRLTTELDPASRALLRGLDRGRAGAFLRQAVRELVDALEAGVDAPRVEAGPAEPFAWKVPETLVNRALAFVGPDRPYAFLSHLLRAAILRNTAAACGFTTMEARNEKAHAESRDTPPIGSQGSEGSGGRVL